MPVAPPSHSMTYTLLELGYLLAGQTTEGAILSRRMLGLPELTEGDPGIPAAVQSLSARSRITVDGDDVRLDDTSKTIGFLLGTSDDWIRLIAATSPQTNVVFVVGSSKVPSALVLSLTPVGTFDVVASAPGVQRSQIAGRTVAAYLQNFDEVTISIDRTIGQEKRELKLERSGDGWRLHRRLGLTGAEILDDPIDVDEPKFLADLEELLG
jgi:hypothetical protein